MNQRAAFLLFALSALIWLHHHATASSIVDFTPATPTKTFATTETEVNALRLRCKKASNKTYISVATVLALENNTNTKQKFDIALTTGHGLSGENGKLLPECFVSFPGGKPYPITAAKLAPNYKPGSASDWAVLLIPKIKNDHLVRYSVGNNLTQKSFAGMVEDRPAVLFSMARGLPINGQNCKVEPRRFAGLIHKNHNGLFSHTCRAIAGQSGSPISVVQNQKSIVIGIHVGTSMVYGYPTLDTPLHYRGYMRGIDKEFMDEFSVTLVDLNAQIQKKSR